MAVLAICGTCDGLKLFKGRVCPECLGAGRVLAGSAHDAHVASVRLEQAS